MAPQSLNQIVPSVFIFLRKRQYLQLYVFHIIYLQINEK